MTGPEQPRRPGGEADEAHRTTGPASPELPPPCTPGPGGCSICGDEGLEGEVVALDADGRSGRVRVADGEVSVAFDLLEEVAPGDRVLVHLGFAIGLVREEHGA